MSKKSRENSSKPAATKVTKHATKSKAAATSAAATKSPAKKAIAKAVTPASKGASKTTLKTSPKTTPKKTTTKTAAKTSKATISKTAPSKAAAAKTAVSKSAVGKTAKAKPPAAKATVAKTPITKIAATKSVKTTKSTAPETAKPTATIAPVAAKAALKAPVAADAPSSGPITEGAKAPAFELQRDGGATVSSADYKGQKLALFFYPRASTPGCTKEAIDFTRLTGDFEKTGTAVLGISADSLKAQESFRDKYALGIPLLSDSTQTMLKSYQAWGEKMMYGKTFEGVLRTTVLIGSDGRIARIWRNVKVDGHADEVLEEARRI